MICIASCQLFVPLEIRVLWRIFDKLDNAFTESSWTVWSVVYVFWLLLMPWLSLKASQISWLRMNISVAVALQLWWIWVDLLWEKNWITTSFSIKGKCVIQMSTFVLAVRVFVALLHMHDVRFTFLFRVIPILVLPILTWIFDSEIVISTSILIL